MPTIKPNIEQRINIDVHYSHIHVGYIFNIYDRVTGDIYLKDHLVCKYDPSLPVGDPVTWVGCGHSIIS